MTPPAVPAPAGRIRVEVRAILELFALCGLAVTQPLLDIFGRAPEQFAFRNVEGAGIVAFALIVTFVPTGALWLVEFTIAFVSRKVRESVHLSAVGLLLFAFALQAVASLASGPARLVAAAAGAILGVVAYRRVAPLRTWLAFMSIAPVIFLLTFLLASPTSRLFSSPDAVAIEGGVGRPAPVVMAVFDELPLASLVDADGSIDAELFPNFAALAGRSHWYRNTTTPSSSTWYAVPALLTGQDVEDGPAPIAADHPESLFTLLGGVYGLNVTESVTRVCPTDLCAPPTAGAGGRRRVLFDAIEVLRSRLSYRGPEGDPVAAFEEPVTAAERGTAATGSSGEKDAFADFGLSQPARVDTFLRGIKDARPELHYLHILLPHVPFRYLPDGARYASPDPDLGRVDDDWADVTWLADQGRQRHLLQLGYVDVLLGRIVDRLKERGVYDESLLVVTADHGISFDAGGPIRGLDGQELDAGALADLAWVPLLVKEPGQTAGDVSDANVSTLDVVPSIADVLNVDIPWRVDGRSVFGSPRRDGAKRFRPSKVNAFGVEALDAIRVDSTTDLAGVFRRGVDRLLAPGGGDERWWRFGPAPDLVGSEVDDPRARKMLSEVRASLDDPGAYEIDPGAELVPALVRGRIEGVAPGEPVAVAVNGVVVATGSTYRAGSGTSFSVMVADRHFRVGSNEVRVYRVRS